ncbi:MAG: polyamine aminopropyltransferase [Planctomycetes bacterium]|nr:polyamine aminopropyltransferase [Planctomycetota bacterium]
MSEPVGDPAPEAAASPASAASTPSERPDEPYAPPESAEEAEAAGRAEAPLATTALFAATFVVATCGLVYELVAGAMGSYLLGDSITQFSLVIGVYLTFMGVGSYVSRYLKGNLLARFVQVEIAVGLLGGLSALGLLGSYALLGVVRPLLFGIVAAIGTLVGLEIPVLMRVLRDELSFSELVARVLAFDYLGALAASLLFPLLCVPLLGLTRTAVLFGLFNTGLACVLSLTLKESLGPRARGLTVQALLASGVLVATYVGANQVTLVFEEQLYEGTILFHRRSPYQKVVVTRWRDDVRLHLDGHLQFSSKDEYRYHEALVHPAVAALGTPLRRALVLGGGDGMALRELLRYPRLEQAVLVDLDPEVTRLFREEPLLTALNARSFHDPRVEAINADALSWLEEHPDVFDLIVIDFPDPRSYSLNKLYTRSFYRLVHRHLAESGALVVQATSPYLAPHAYWCIASTIEDAEFTVHPYHAHVPSFGDWGFVLATPQDRGRPTALAAVEGLRFLDAASLGALFSFPADQPRLKLEVNRLHDPVLVGYHETDWRTSLGE